MTESVILEQPRVQVGAKASRPAVRPAILYTMGQAAELLGISKRTLYRWDRAGKLCVQHTPRGHRRFSDEEIARLRIFVRRRLADDLPT